MNDIRRQQGFSLIELMIALVLGLLVTGAVIQLFLATSQTGRAQEAMSRIQETGRFALEIMKPRFRLAGRTNACVVDMEVSNHLDPDGAGYVDKLFDPAEAIVGWEYDDTGPDDTYSVGTTFAAAGTGAAGDWANADGDALPEALAALAIPGSDVIVVKSAQAVRGLTACNNNNVNRNSININWNTGGNGCNAEGPDQAPLSAADMERLLPQRGLVLVTDCSSGGDLFQRTSRSDSAVLTSGNMQGASPGNVTGNWSTQYGETMQVFTLGVRAYFVGVNGFGEPALYELNYGSAGAGATPEELVSGIESMQLLFGEETAGGVVYRTADEVTDTGDIASIVVEILVRSTVPADSESETGPFAVLGTDVSTPADRRLRKTFRMTVAARNRIETI